MLLRSDWATKICELRKPVRLEVVTTCGVAESKLVIGDRSFASHHHGRVAAIWRC